MTKTVITALDYQGVEKVMIGAPALADEQRTRFNTFTPDTIPEGISEIRLYGSPKIIRSNRPVPSVASTPAVPSVKAHRDRRSQILAGTAALLIACLPLAARAQTYSFETLSTGLAVVAAGATSNTLSTAGIIDRIKSPNQAVQVSFNCSASNATNGILMTWVKSIDGSLWSTDDTLTWSILATSTTNTIIATTNWVVGGVGYLKLKSLQNLVPSGNLTLESVKYSIKKDIP